MAAADPDAKLDAAKDLRVTGAGGWVLEKTICPAPHLAKLETSCAQRPQHSARNPDLESKLPRTLQLRILLSLNPKS